MVEASLLEKEGRQNLLLTWWLNYKMRSRIKSGMTLLILNYRHAELDSASHYRSNFLNFYAEPFDTVQDSFVEVTQFRFQL